MARVEALTGRAHRLIGPLMERVGRLHAAQAPCLLLVPEQFTLQAERELLDRLNLDGMFTLQAMSPSRLCERVLEAVGSDGREPLGRAGRLMAVSRAVELCEDGLRYYAAASQRRGFAPKMSALLTDMKRGGLTADALRAYAETLQGSQEAKYADLALLYATYERVLGGRFSDGEDMTAYVAGRLAESGLLEGVHLFVYGFDTLTEPLIALLCAAAPLCESVTAALVCEDAAAPDGDLYEPVRQSIARFAEALTRQGVALRYARSPERELAAAPAIRHLDETLFRLPYRKLDGPQQSVFLAMRQSPYEEAALAAREIRWLLQNGTPPEAIAVLHPEGGGYAFAVSAALGDADVPFYTDDKLPAATHGLARFLLCALRAAATGYRNEDVLPLLKSGYAGLSFEEACQLENYALSYGVNRARWTEPFRKGPDELHLAMESLRARALDPILRMRAALVAARSAEASLAAVFALLQDVGAYETLKREEDELLREGLLARAGQNSQVWQALLTLSEQLCQLMDGARVPLKAIADRFESGLAAVRLAALPPATGMVRVGTLGHFLGGEVQAAFLLGLNDGLLQKQTESLLSEEERAATREATGAYLGVTDQSRSTLARLDLKSAMTLPTRYLFLSCAKTAPDGAALRPLPLLQTLRDRLLAVLPETPMPETELPMTASQALAELSLRLRAFADGSGAADALPARWRNRLTALLRSPTYRPQALALLRAAGSRADAEAIAPRTAQALYGGEGLSVSRLERFAECPFEHFVVYGLRPQVRKEWRVEPIDTGTFYHAALNGFSHLAQQTPGYPEVPAETVDRLAEEAMAPLLEALADGPMGDGERSLHQQAVARETVRRAAQTVTRHLAAGRFRLERTEAAFGYPGGLPPIVLVLADGRQVMLRGYIDRIDRYDDGPSVYLRVIDYKSSRRDLDAAQTWWGLQLQLLLYLDAAQALAEGSVPAGAFYFYVADPLVETAQDAQTCVEAELRKLLQLRGVALSDVEVLTAMDESGQGEVLPTMLTKEGKPYRTAKALDEAQMRALLAHAREVAGRLAARMLDGETAARPWHQPNQLACDRCDYRAVCGLDAAAPDAERFDAPPMSAEQWRTLLAQAGE